MGKRNGVRKLSESSIGVSFNFMGVRCRERLKLLPTPAHMKYAKDLLGQIRVEIARGTFDYAKHFPSSARADLFARLPGQVLTMGPALEQWLKDKGPEVEHSTMTSYRRIVNNVLIPFCGDDRLTDFNRVRAKALIASLGNVSAKRINNVLGPLRGLLQEALEDGLIETNPLETIKIRRKRKIAEEGDGSDGDDDSIDPFTPEEVAAILAAAKDPQFRNFYQFNFATGMRMSEVFGLWWRRCDFIQHQARVMQAQVEGQMKSTKTKAGKRDVILLPSAMAALQAQRSHTQLAGREVFQCPLTGEPWLDDQQLRKGFWIPTLKRAGVRYRAPKQMRHTFASQALSAGENVMWVAAQLGHKNWYVTAKNYARWIRSIVPEAGLKLAALQPTVSESER
jgi:integrase